MTPGFLRISAEAYHADPCPAPSLSSSVARVLLEQSPRHAWTLHPKSPLFEPEEENNKALDFGSAAHALMLGAGPDIEVVRADNWTTKAAREARDLARSQGKAPILNDDFARAAEMVDVGREQLRAVGLGHVFADDKLSEQAIIWQDEGGVWCRAMLDWHHEEAGQLFVYDYKTTSRSSHPGSLGFKIVDHGYDLQAGFYERGLGTLRPELLGRITWRWVFQETEPPFAVTVAELDGAGRTIGAKKAAAAVSIWRRCMETGEWPLWPAGVHRITYPQKAENAWLEREMDERDLGGLHHTPLYLREVPRMPLTDLPKLLGA